ncbi:hypothetical protein BH09BAC3_BH09BAC3_15140 [soil metagenome]
MKNNIIKFTFPVALITLIIACNPKKEELAAVVIDKEQVKKEIQAREDEFASVYNSGETKDIGYYADDAISFFQNKAPLIGREAIVEFLKSDVSSSPNKISFTTKEVFVSNDGNQVVEIGSFKVVDSTSTTLNSGNYMSLFEKRNGKYVSVRDISASDQPIQ